MGCDALGAGRIRRNCVHNPFKPRLNDLGLPPGTVSFADRVVDLTRGGGPSTGVYGSLLLPLSAFLAFTFMTFGIPGTLWPAMRARTFAT